jgi:hypothetical protein
MSLIINNLRALRSHNLWIAMVSPSGLNDIRERRVGRSNVDLRSFAAKAYDYASLSYT